MRKVGLMLLMLALGVGIGVRISGRMAQVEGQAKPGAGFAAVPGELGSEDLTGPYELVKGWPKDISTLPGNEKWTYGAGESVFAESPNRIYALFRGELPKMFEDEIWALKPGSVSPVIRTESSFHIFKVDEKRPAGVVDIQSAAPVIRERLREDAVRQRIAELVGRARKEVPIAVLTKRLPFRYTGTLPKSENE